MTFVEITLADLKLATKTKVRLHDGFELNGVLTKHPTAEVQSLTLVHADPATRIHLIHEINVDSIARAFQDKPTVAEKFNVLPIGTFFTRNNMPEEFADENDRLRQKITDNQYIRWDRGSARRGPHINVMRESRWRNDSADTLDVLTFDEGAARLKAFMEGARPS